LVDVALNAIATATVILTVECAIVAFAVGLVVVDRTTVVTRGSPAVVASGTGCQLTVVTVVPGAIPLFVGMSSATFTVGIVVVGIATVRTSTVVGKDIVVTSVSAIFVRRLCAAVATDVPTMNDGIRPSAKRICTVSRVAAGGSTGSFTNRCATCTSSGVAC
jgi:hypothetical protein